MERFQVEEIYRALGIKNFKLENLEELEKCHGINVNEIKGYKDLTNENKDIFEKFLLNYFNQSGLDKKMTFKPIQINYVEELDAVAEDPDDVDCIITVKLTIKAIYKDGKKKIIHQYKNKEANGLEVIKTYIKKYLRFEFKEYGQKIWLHLINGNQWY